MQNKRKKLPVDVQRAVLHEAGFKCANPACRTILTLDLHHMEYVSDGGRDETHNLLALCPNCHRLHHLGQIPTTSIRAWKMLLLTLNEAYDRRSVEILLALAHVGRGRNRALEVSGDGVLRCSALIAGGLVELSELFRPSDLKLTLERTTDSPPRAYGLRLTDAGRAFVTAWRDGDQAAAINAIGSPDPATSARARTGAQRSAPAKTPRPRQARAVSARGGRGG